MNSVATEAARGAVTRLIVLSSVSELYATKRIRRDRKTGKIVKTPHGRETHFQIKGVDLNGFDHLCKCLGH